MKLLFFSLVLLVSVDARLEFDYSTLFDMEDFHGTPEYPITFCTTGCRAYLTYPNDECPRNPCLGDQDIGPFTIELPNGGAQIKFIDLNNKKLTNGEKAYFDIPFGTDQFIVRNPNGNGAVRPLALWVVRNTAPLLSELQVFDAADGAKISASASRVVLMSVATFTINANVAGAYSLTVKPSPFEMIDSDKCEYVYKTDSTVLPSFSLSVNSPLITLGFDAKKSMTATTDHSYSYDRSIDVAGYLSGPGYIGCNNRTQLFRSESYNFESFNETFLVEGAKVRHVYFNGYLNNEVSPALLYDMDTDDEPLRVVGKDTKWEHEMQTSKFSLFWDASFRHEETFMIRYTVDATVSSMTPKILDPTATPKAYESTTSPSSFVSMALAVFSVLSAMLL